MNGDKIEDIFVDLILELSNEFGFSVEDPNLVDTPKRLQRMYRELLSGYHQNPADILKVEFPSEAYDQMIVVRDIKFYSLCSHHFLPFIGWAHVAYIPHNNKVTGLSKISRLVQIYAKRFQIQERMTQQIAHAIEEHLSPDVGVVVEAQHLCMAMRGAKQNDGRMVTSAMLGAFRNEGETRKEFLSLIKSHHRN